MTKYNVILAFSDYEVEVDALDEEAAKLHALDIFKDDIEAHDIVKRMWIADVNLI